MRLDIWREKKQVARYDNLDADGLWQVVHDELQLYAFLEGEPEPTTEDIDDQVAALLASRQAGVRPFMRLDAEGRSTAYLAGAPEAVPA